jgi:hypothetical protein
MYYFPLLQIIIFKNRENCLRLSFLCGICREIGNRYRKTEQITVNHNKLHAEAEVGHFLYFHCKDRRLLS